MNNQERDLISNFIARVGGAPQAGIGSVPSTNPSLPPIDPEADTFIAQNFQRYPEARYRVTQMAVVQEAALVEAQNRIRELQFQLQQAQQALQQAQQSKGSSGGFFGGLFGGGQQRTQQAPPPGWGGQPGYAQQPQMQPQMQPMPPGFQPGMFRQGGSGFLGSALTTAAGVAGGMMAANALEGLFSGHHDTGAAAGGWGAPDQTVVNNYYGDSAAGASDPFAGAGTTADPGFDAGGDDGGWGGDGGDWGGGDDQSF
ncbi:DUF2076 domain-containing protein [Acetobacter sp.]|jgi:hypothetical protein|uniref:DUF2076 domain-containing protein n=1 Tax=Acetobacter sp. TaxID=440 RepID=UPI0025C5CEF6|nr:DUF2076 domain-containing protein [Acetobacter sp.]MCH4092412.1 DUF2076 domain-containing protein [Acetobacter sp.]MCI1299545.1 DUF2076 domain-containing protein [Acetobacter sp.]MCI1315575.1 DUF2076 domain-containing protein [Acetobacter sp.]